MPVTSQFLATACYDQVATIPAGQTTSNEFDLAGCTLLGVFAPAMTGTSLALQAAYQPGGPYSAVTDGTGVAVAVPVLANSYLPVPSLAALKGVRWGRVVSNAAEAAARSLTLAAAPV